MRTEEWQGWLGSQLFEQVPCSIAVIDRDFRIVDTNRRFVEHFGEGTGRPCYEVYKKRDRRCDTCPTAGTFTDGKTRVNEEVGVDANGRRTHYLVHIFPVFGEDGKVAFVIEMSTDITETKRLQREYRTLFESVPCFVAVLNRDYRIVKANRRLRETFGETTGQHCYEVFKDRAEKCSPCPVELVFRDGGAHLAEMEGVNKDGDPCHYILRASPAEPGEGEVTHVIETALDVTELRQIERDKVIAERLAAVGQTVAGLAHGIKNILTGLEGGIYFMDTGLKRSDQKRVDRGWGMLQRNIDKISVLTRNLLSFSKGRELEAKLVDPSRLVREVADLFVEAARQSGIEVRTEIADGIREASLDPEGLHDCLSNLVSNALDACQLSDREESHVVVRCREERDDLVFEVADDGCGMDREVQKLAFTNFFTTKGSGGTGLGLLLTRKIVQEHGGRIAFESSSGEGTLFRLTFPRSRLPEPASEDENEKEKS
jgi:PAS domain S-box-containing protein